MTEPTGAVEAVDVDEDLVVDGEELVDSEDEPYSLTELSNGLEALANRLDQTEDHFGGALDKVSKAVLELRDQVAELIKKQAEKDIEPQPWTDRASPAQWDELVNWVDWLQAKYGALPEYDIPPCWPAHTGVVEELAGLFHSWKRAQIVDELAEKSGSNELVAWHDRWFWPLRQRARSGHYRTTNCKESHRSNGSPRNRPIGNTCPATAPAAAQPQRNNERRPNDEHSTDRQRTSATHSRAAIRQRAPDLRSGSPAGGRPRPGPNRLH